MDTMTNRKRYAIVGTGGRGRAVREALATTYAGVGELVGLCDLSQARMNWYKARSLPETADLAPLPTLSRRRLPGRMVAETKPDTVIVTTMDSTHHD